MALPRRLEPLFSPSEGKARALFDCAGRHSLRRIFGRALRKRELLAGSTTFALAPVLWIEERIIPDRDRRINLGDLVDLIFL